MAQSIHRGLDTALAQFTMTTDENGGAKLDHGSAAILAVRAA
jgi:hypothetical protein